MARFSKVPRERCRRRRRRRRKGSRKCNGNSIVVTSSVSSYYAESYFKGEISCPHKPPFRRSVALSDSHLCISSDSSVILPSKKNVLNLSTEFSFRESGRVVNTIARSVSRHEVQIKHRITNDINCLSLCSTVWCVYVTLTMTYCFLK